ncbi:unnamed protein product, partial [Staurois parvus]
IHISPCPLTSLAVFPSVARGKVSTPQAVTPSYTRKYPAALLRDPFCTYLVVSLLQCPLQCPPADAGICLLGSVPCNVRTYGGRNWREIH